MQILKKRTHTLDVTLRHAFSWRSQRSAGFSFNCDEHGNVGTLPTAAAENLHRCLTGEIDVVDEGIERTERWIHEPAIGRCNHCTSEVVLSGFTNTCDCGTDYNMSGQELAPREQWGEETGETADDILNLSLEGEY